VLGALGLTVPLRPAADPVTVAAPATLVEPAGPATVTFPLGPPADAAGAPDLRLAAGLPTLSVPVPGAPGVTATLTASTWPPGVLAAATGTAPATVRGLPGRLVTWSDGGEPELSLVWQDGAGQWLELRAFPPVPAEHLAGFAKTLVAQPVTAPAPFEFALVPAGYTIDNISPSAVTFCPPGTAPDESFVGKLTVMLGVAAEWSPGRAVDVGGRPATLRDSGDSTTLQVDLGDGRLLELQSAATVPLEEPDLLRFAAGITVTPSATPGQG
ncbi:hypothetical protein PQF33_22900, partial [Dactylosporangium aurantiacum]|nr:hypothetical protein [Dactylosporangium aurantiacum]